MGFSHNIIQSIMPALYVVVGLEWAAVVHVPQVEIVVGHRHEGGGKQALKKA